MTNTASNEHQHPHIKIPLPRGLSISVADLPQVDRLCRFLSNIKRDMGEYGYFLKEKDKDNIHTMVARGQYLIASGGVGDVIRGAISVRPHDGHLPAGSYQDGIQNAFHHAARNGAIIAEVNGFAVDPLMQGRGLGHLLIEHAQNHAKEQGIHYLFSRVVQENAKGLHVFEGAGFWVAGTSQRENDPTIRQFILTKVLQDTETTGQVETQKPALFY